MAEHTPDANARVLAIGSGDPIEYKTIVCLTDNSFDLAITDITSETKCGTLSEPGTVTTTVSVSGVILLDPDDDDVISAPDLFTIANSRTKFPFKYGPIVPVSGDVVYTGYGFFTAYNETDSVNTNSTFTGAIKVDKNGLTKTVTP